MLRHIQAVPLSEINDETQKQVLLYTMRFKEVVFVRNVINDDRFCNTPSVRSVISLPIFQGKDLLGVLYLVSLDLFFWHICTMFVRSVIGFYNPFFIARLPRRSIVNLTLGRKA